jgi:survival-of-motor-neuron-related-splicing factor 30
VSSLQTDPDNAELASLQTELGELISLTETAIAEQKAVLQAAPPKPAPKENRFKNNNFQKPEQSTDEAPTPTTPASFAVNDTVLARWVSGDNAFYPAKITSMTGSSTNPVYLVSFKSYGTVENLTAKDIRPISGSDSRKRKADGTPGSSASPSPAPLGVISAAADINPALATQARSETSLAGDGPPRPAKAPRKVKANKELEEGKNKWKDFAAKTKGKGKFGKKDSMFRTGDGVNARGMIATLSILDSIFPSIWCANYFFTQLASRAPVKPCEKTRRDLATSTNKPMTRAIRLRQFCRADETVRAIGYVIFHFFRLMIPIWVIFMLFSYLLSSLTESLAMQIRSYLSLSRDSEFLFIEFGSARSRSFVCYF